MSCLTCLRVQREADMLTVENPARGGQSMGSFKLCMGCAAAIAAGLLALKEGKVATILDGRSDAVEAVGSSRIGVDSGGAVADPDHSARADEPLSAIDRPIAQDIAGGPASAEPRSSSKARGVRKS